MTDRTPSRLARFFRSLGPGLVTGAADDDPSGIGTHSQIGAQFGYGLAWTFVLSFPLMVVIQQVAAEIGRVTGAGIARNLRRHYPRPVLVDDGDAAAGRQHRQPRRRSERDGRGAAAARPAAMRCSTPCCSGSSASSWKCG